MVVLLAQWTVCRIPLAFRLVWRKGNKGYQSENAFFRQMLQELVLPLWCSQVIVVADAAYASRQNLQAMQARHRCFEFAFPRTWNCADGHCLHDLVAHLLRVRYRKVCLPLMGSRARYRFFGPLPNQPRCVRSEMSAWSLANGSATTAPNRPKCWWPICRKRARMAYCQYTSPLRVLHIMRHDYA